MQQAVSMASEQAMHAAERGLLPWLRRLFGRN